jgi:hypothetical protein
VAAVGGKLLELLVGCEGLGRGARRVVGTLLHEGAHSVCYSGDLAAETTGRCAKAWCRRYRAC